MENTVVSAKEAQMLLATIKFLLKTPLQGEPLHPAALLARYLGVVQRPMAEDQWYLLSADVLRAFFPKGTEARKNAEAIDAACVPDKSEDAESGEGPTVNREAVQIHAEEIRQLLREAAANAELFASRSTPEDLELRIKEGVNRYLWRSAAVRIIVVGVLFVAGFYGFDTLRGLNTRLNEEVAKLNNALDEEVKNFDKALNQNSQALASRVDEVKNLASNLVNEAQETLIAATSQMNQINNEAEAIGIRLRTLTAEAQSEIARSQNEITNTISQSNQQIATLYVNVSQRLEGLEEKTTDKFVQALETKSSALNQKLAALENQANDLEGKAEVTASQLGSAMNSADTLSSQVVAATAAVEKVGGAVSRVEGQVAGIEMQAAAVATRLSGLGEAAQKDVEGIQQHATQARSLVGEAGGHLNTVMASRRTIEAVEIEFTRDLADLQAALDKVTGEVEAVEMAVGDLSTRTKQSDASQQASSQRLGTLEAQLGLLEASAGHLDGRKDAMEESLTELEADAATQRGTLAAIGTMVEQMKSGSADLERRLETLQSTVSYGHEQLDGIVSLSETLREKLEGLQSVHAALQPVYEGTLANLQQATQAYRDAISDYQPLLEEIRTVREQIDFLLQESDSDRIEIGELAKKLTGDWMTLDARVITTATDIEAKMQSTYREKAQSIRDNQEQKR